MTQTTNYQAPHIQARRETGRAMQRFVLICLTLIAMAQDGLCSASLRRRQLQNTPYFQVDDPTVLGELNREAALGNPLKGLFGGIRWSQGPLSEAVPLSMEWANFGLDEMMVGENKFDWALLDSYIEGSANRNRHLVFSVYIHWPGNELRLPPHLLDIEMRPTDEGPSPFYGDTKLLTALQQFIYALGARYDGDKRIAAIHLGLLGFWGEFHTYPYDYVPESSKQNVVQWYREAFTKTQLQARYPRTDAADMGLYDGSFAYHTLDGAPNGGVDMSWFFWPQINKAGQFNSWRTNIMGGETRPQIQKVVFTDEYPAGTENNQDFKLCAKTTHMSFVLHHDAFQNGGYAGDMLERALDAHSYLGYNFRVSKVAVAASLSDSDEVDLTVTVVNEGIAPFYYDLSIELECPGMTGSIKAHGVEKLIDEGKSGAFSLSGVPASPECLQGITLKLTSSYAYKGRPIKFAQGNGIVVLSLPGPDDGATDGRSGPMESLEEPPDKLGGNEEEEAVPKSLFALLWEVLLRLMGFTVGATP